MDKENLSVGVFDSGVGGISTLSVLNQYFPNENFVFLGDSLNAPYGDKEKSKVIQLSENIVNQLLQFPVKAIVIACNTATSAAKNELCELYPYIPIIGIEPALKKAVDSGSQSILVMGTKLTLELEKFNKLLSQYSSNTAIHRLACPGLADLIEQDISDTDAIDQLLEKLLKPFLNEDIDSIVLGCTHYPFVKDRIQKLFDKEINFFTGFTGVAKQLEQQLKDKDALTNRNSRGRIEFFSSKKDNDEIQLYKNYFEFAVENIRNV
ncbi:glutamate racemase [Tetragenococcus halophilus subsp. flandriensis]|uniref:glutamate racemase n=1 Tax=Tetragenococcus halophilus TaxID=51669 RepID=UPI0023E9E858|nr:glutamate racemase [Tetragenococcus halophilus]GMA08244.1 glutamate racemase [Tetragenococcus halophilus subsp. flandriensis]